MCILDTQLTKSSEHMSSTFAIRFAVILFSVMAVAAILIHFILNSQHTIIFWIFAVPFILGIPILASVVLASNEELDLSTVQ
jgi:uncharacterized membrane protein